MCWFFGNNKKIPVGISPINKNIAIGHSHGHKTLYADGIQQSGGEFVGMWNKVVGITHKRVPNPATILVLGVGAGTVIHRLRKTYPVIPITGVDIDALILQTAKTHFGLSEKGKTILINDDALTWLSGKDRLYFSLIFTDIFIGLHNPPQFRDGNFFSLLSGHLEPGGVAVVNLHYDPAKPDEFEQTVTLAATVFTEVKTVFSFLRNRVILLSHS